MVFIFPEELDESTVKSPAEVTIYKNLKQSLSSDYVVIHSVRWTPNPRSQLRKMEPEIDFLIMRADWTILCMEVKGGLIEMKNKEWYQNGRKIEDPFQQAIDNKHSLMDFIKSKPGYGDAWIPIDCCLAFPDTYVNPAAYIADELVLDSHGLGAINDWVESAMKYALAKQTGNKTLTNDMISLIVNLFAQGRTARLFQKFQQQEREFARLTERQFKLLDQMRNQRRAVVAGCAGSGKTFLAIEKAKRLATKDFSVLLTCQNEELASFMREQLVDFPNVIVKSFFEVCYFLAEKTGEGLRAFTKRATQSAQFFDLVMPADLENNINMLIDKGEDPRFDAVIVDEAQMFHELWWVALDKLLLDGEKGIRYIFYDDNQRVYGERDEIPGEESRLILDENCRNTRHIHWATIQFYESDEIPSCNRVEGLPVEVYEYADGHDMMKKLSKILHTIIIEGRVSAKDVIILTPRDSSELERLESKKFGAIRLSPQDDADPNCVRFTTVQNYRGLERKVVILAEMDKRSVNYPEILYIGMSRARDHLVILYSLDLSADVKNQILACSREPNH